jgi:hypothetical protein
LKKEAEVRPPAEIIVIGDEVIGDENVNYQAVPFQHQRLHPFQQKYPLYQGYPFHPGFPFYPRG